MLFSRIRRRAKADYCTTGSNSSQVLPSSRTDSKCKGRWNKVFERLGPWASATVNFCGTLFVLELLCFKFTFFLQALKPGTKRALWESRRRRRRYHIAGTRGRKLVARHRDLSSGTYLRERPRMLLESNRLLPRQDCVLSFGASGCRLSEEFCCHRSLRPTTTPISEVIRVSCHLTSSCQRWVSCQL
jgi:hypothetical protein